MNPATKRRADALGLTVTHYSRQGDEWLPMDLVGHNDGVQRLIVYRKADDHYDFDGWAPWASKPFPSHGGRYSTIEAALGWLEWVGSKGDRLAQAPAVSAAGKAMCPRGFTEDQRHKCRDVARQGSTAFCKSCDYPLPLATPSPAQEDDYILPCDVAVPPATTIRAGCSLTTLKCALELEGRPKHFNGPPRKVLAAQGEEPTIPAGMVPWHGGDSAPEDWDLKSVMTRGGVAPDWRNGRFEWAWRRPLSERDIIAYTPKASAHPAPDVEAMRERAAEVAELWARRWGVTDDNPTHAAGMHIAAAIRALPTESAGGSAG